MVTRHNKAARGWRWNGVRYEGARISMTGPTARHSPGRARSAKLEFPTHGKPHDTAAPGGHDGKLALAKNPVKQKVATREVCLRLRRAVHRMRARREVTSADATATFCHPRLAPHPA